MNLKEIRHNLKKFFRGDETEEGRWLIDQWYRFFRNKSSELTGYSIEEKEKIRRDLWANIEAATSSPDKQQRLPARKHSPDRISWPGRIAAGFIIVLLALLPVL